MNPTPQIQPLAESELVDRLTRRDEQALGTLYDMYSAALYGIVVRVVRDDRVAEDVTQETFVKIWRSIDSYDASKGRLFTWMLRIARNGALDAVKSRGYRDDRKNQPIEDVVHLVERSEQTETNIDAIGVEGVIGMLTPEQQQLIDLLYFQGYTQQEVSDELHIPLGTIKTRARAAIGALRRMLSDDSDRQEQHR